MQGRAVQGSIAQSRGGQPICERVSSVRGSRVYACVIARYLAENNRSELADLLCDNLSLNTFPTVFVTLTAVLGAFGL